MTAAGGFKRPLPASIREAIEAEITGAIASMKANIYHPSHGHENDNLN